MYCKQFKVFTSCQEVVRSHPSLVSALLPSLCRLPSARRGVYLALKYLQQKTQVSVSSLLLECAYLPFTKAIGSFGASTYHKERPWGIHTSRRRRRTMAGKMPRYRQLCDARRKDCDLPFLFNQIDFNSLASQACF